jgi:hypothetical protein
MTPITRRDFLAKASALTLATFAMTDTPRSLQHQPEPIESQTILVNRVTAQ